MGCNPLTCVCGSYTFPQRVLLCILLLLGIIVAYSARACLNMAITKMVIHNDTAKEIAGVCKSDPKHDGEKVVGSFHWTENEQYWVLMGFFPGYVITHIPGGIMSDLLGGKMMFMMGCVVSAVMSLLTPLSVSNSNHWNLVMLRFVMGLSQGPLFPSASAMLSKWVPKHERGTLATLVNSGSHLGTITGNLFSGLLIASQGWRFVFYFWGIISMIWSVFFYIFCYSEPSKHPHITPKEAEMLDECIGATEKFSIPWYGILTDWAVWGQIIGEIGHDWIFFVACVQMPKYMADVVKFDIKKNSLVNSFPFFCLWCSSAISGIIADKLINKYHIKLVSVRRVATIIGNIGPTLFLIVASYLGCNKFGNAAMFTIALTIMGPFYAGLRINNLDITKHFAGIIMAFVNGIGAFAYMPIPHLVGAMAPNHKSTEWQKVFWMMCGGVTLTTVAYVHSASGERAKWDYVTEREDEPTDV